MPQLDDTLAHLAPGVTTCRDLNGFYNPRHGLAIYSLPIADYSPASPGMVLGEALAARSGLGCTLLEGVPARVPEGAVVIAEYADLRAARPDLVEDVPELREHGQYAIKLGRTALVTSLSSEGLASGMQTLAMIILRNGLDRIPGSVILDTPLCHSRCLAVELKTGEIGINLLLQIASFAATFKANRLHVVLDNDFEPSVEIPGIDTFSQVCHSLGLTVGVRVPFLGAMLSGKKTVRKTWTKLRAVARVFGASQAVLDDPCPPGADPEMCAQIVESAVKGEVGLSYFSMDAKVMLLSGRPPAELRESGLFGWYRFLDSAEPPDRETLEFPLAFDVQAPVPGFSSRTVADFHLRLDAAMKRLRRTGRRDLTISFRDVGISHMWQNLLYPAAAGLIVAWGNPTEGREAAKRFNNLLYGESDQAVMDMWDVLATAFPPGLTAEEERIVRRTAFGTWPESEEVRSVLTGIDWLTVTKNIKIAAETLKSAAAGLTRNAGTLSGARLALYALSWLHCFVVLTPELERRRREKDNSDGRTEPIAAELANNFGAWHGHLRELYGESGLEFTEMPDIESMGLRLKGLCEGIFE